MPPLGVVFNLEACHGERQVDAAGRLAGDEPREVELLENARGHGPRGVLLRPKGMP